MARPDLYDRSAVSGPLFMIRGVGKTWGTSSNEKKRDCEQSVLRTETTGYLITIIFSVIQLIASGTEIILSRSNYIASLPDSIVSEAKLIMFKPEMIASKLEIILSTTTRTA